MEILEKILDELSINRIVKLIEVEDYAYFSKLLSLTERKRLNGFFELENPKKTDLYYLIRELSYDNRRLFLNILFTSGFLVDENTIFSPSDIAGLLFYTKAEIEPRTDWNVAGFQLDNEANATKNLKLFTGGGINFQSANSDYVSIPNVVLTGINWTLTFMATLPNNNTRRILGVISVEFFIDRIKIKFGVTYYSIFADFNYVSSTEIKVISVVSDKVAKTLKVYINGVLSGTTTDVINDEGLFQIQTISAYGAVPFNGTIKDVAFFKSTLNESQISNLYNNPQRFIELSREYGAERIYPLSEGRYLNNDTVLDYSVNAANGTFLTLAAGAYNAALNNIEFGLQTALQNYNVTGGRQILALTTDGTVDLNSNPILKPRKVGQLNGLGGLHGGTEAINLGNCRTFAFAIKVPTASVNQTVFNLGAAGNVTIDTSAIVCAAFSSIVVDVSGNTILNDTWHYVEMQNVTDVLLDALKWDSNSDCQIVPFLPYSGQITTTESTRLKAYVENLY